MYIWQEPEQPSVTGTGGNRDFAANADMCGRAYAPGVIDATPCFDHTRNPEQRSKKRLTLRGCESGMQRTPTTGEMPALCVNMECPLLSTPLCGNARAGYVRYAAKDRARRGGRSGCPWTTTTKPEKSGGFFAITAIQRLVISSTAPKPRTKLSHTLVSPRHKTPVFQTTSPKGRTL